MSGPERTVGGTAQSAKGHHEPGFEAFKRVGALNDKTHKGVKESSVKTVTAFWSATKSRSTSWTATRFDGHAKSDELETLPAVDAWLEHRDALPPQDRTNFPSNAKDWIL